MSMKMVCDRCGCVKDSTDIFSGIAFVKVIHGQPGEQSVRKITRDYDICESCAVEFEKFIDGGEVEEDHYKDSKPCAVVIHKLASGHYGIENDLKKSDMDKEESDLSVKSHKVTCPTTGETITVPDGKPWSSAKDVVNYCSICEYESCKADEAPCKDCHGRSNWKPKESIF